MSFENGFITLTFIGWSSLNIAKLDATFNAFLFSKRGEDSIIIFLPGIYIVDSLSDRTTVASNIASENAGIVKVAAHLTPIVSWRPTYMHGMETLFQTSRSSQTIKLKGPSFSTNKISAPSRHSSWRSATTISSNFTVPRHIHTFALPKISMGPPVGLINGRLHSFNIVGVLPLAIFWYNLIDNIVGLAPVSTVKVMFTSWTLPFI